MSSWRFIPHPPGHQEMLMVLHRKQVLLRELQVIVVTKPPQDSPGGLVSATLDEESVQEQETCGGRPVTEVEQVEGNCCRSLKTLKEDVAEPLSVSPLPFTPSVMFLLTTFLTSSKA